MLSRKAFTLIELLVVIAIIAILAVVVVLTLNPAQLLAQSRDANRVSDMATLQSALNLYTTDQSGNLQLGTSTNTYISIPDPNASTTCGSLGMLSLGSSSWACSSSSNYRLATSTGWLGINFNLISSGSPFGSLPVDPVNQTSTGLFYAYNTNGSQFEVIATLESTKYKAQYGNNPSTNLFPEVISGGIPTISALYNPTGLVGYWPINEGNGSTTLDQSGNGDAGTWGGSFINGTHYTSGKIGSYGGNFNGTNDYINVGNPNILQAPIFTVTAWVQRGTISNYQSFVSNFNASAANNGAFMLRGGNASNMQCVTYDTGSVVHVANSASNSMGSTGAWYFVGCVYDGSNLLAYLNGALAATPVSEPNPPYYGLNYPFFIGVEGSSTAAIGNVLTGTIDDVRFYNRALSSAEIMALYNAGK